MALASRLYKLAPPLCFLVLLAGSTGFGQESSGSITGIVTDSTGGVVTGARVPTLELRGEFLNAFNRVEFNSPKLNSTSADSGRVMSQRNLRREVQIALKLLF